jgi:hypothetical protein
MLVSASTIAQAQAPAVKHTAKPVAEFTTAQLSKKQTTIPDNPIAKPTRSMVTRAPSPSQIGMQFLALTPENARAFYRAQPNCNGWVGPTQYILNTNQHIRSFNKTTGLADGVLDVDSGSFMGSPTADTMLIYNRGGQNWIASADLTDFTNATYPEPSVSLAFSDAPIITADTKWTIYHFPSATLVPTGPAGQTFVDSPKLSADNNAVYLSIDVFGGPSLDYIGVTLVVIPQSSFVAGNPFDYTVFSPLFTPTQFPNQIGFAPVANNFDSNPQFGYLIVSPATEVYDTDSYTNYYMYRILDAGTSSPSLYPAFSPTPPFATPISLSCPVYADANNVPHLGNLFGANGLLQAFTALDNMPVVRNHQLYFANVGAVNQAGVGTIAGDRMAILWYQYDLTGGTGVETESTIPTLVQSGVIWDSVNASNPLNYFNPSIMADLNNNVVIIGNVCGANNYIQAFYTTRNASDTLGQLQPLTMLTTNTNEYNYGTLCYTDPNCMRWGDYNSLSPDPSNDLNIWATNQIVSAANLWGILAVQLTPA